MSSRIAGRTFLFKSLLTGAAICAVSALIAPKVQAQTAQAAVEAALLAEPHVRSTTTINTATAAELETAVATAIGSTSFTPAALAVAALEPYPLGVTGAKVRADRNTTGPGIVSAVVTELITLSDTSFATDVAAVTDQVVDVNQPVATEDLSLAGREAVVKSALGAISNAYVSLTNTFPLATLLAADSAIGTALAKDGSLTALATSGLTTILQTSILGIDGLTGRATAAAPYAAENFVAGIISSGTAPNGATLPNFAVSILKDVSTNLGVDELVAYQIGLQTSGTSALVNTATTLFLKYPTAEAKITQGLAASIPATNAGVSDANRVAFISALASTDIKAATPVLEGAVYTDPYYAPDFAGAVMTDIYNSTTTTTHGTTDTGHALLTADAAGIALGVGGILGQDGDALTGVSGTFAGFVANGSLPVADAGLYATDLITGAVKSTIPASALVQFTAGSSGGKLYVGPGTLNNNTIALATVVDLESIEDLFANAILTKYGASLVSSSADVTLAASEIGALAKAIAGFTKDESYTNGSSQVALVAPVLAGSIAELVASFNLTPFTVGTKTYNPQTQILAAIEADDEAAALAVKTSVEGVFTASNPLFYANDTTYGVITTDETSVTNF